MFLYSRIKFTLNIEKDGKEHILQDFKAFAMKGNVIDMAVGVVIGGAFGKIVSSLVANVIMPPIGFTGWRCELYGFEMGDESGRDRC